MTLHSPVSPLEPAGFGVVEAMQDPAIWRPVFEPLGTRDPAIALLRASRGEPMTPEQERLFKTCTRRQSLPTKPASEVWVAAGRRSGKSHLGATIAVHRGCFWNYRSVISPGERITIAVIAADRPQARNVFRYIEGLIDAVPMLSAMVERRTADSIDLNNQVTLEVRTCNHRTIRGYTIALAILDEVGHWFFEDSANSDYEVLTSLRPALATVPGSQIICLSTPHARRGVLWDAYCESYGRDDDNIVFWQAPSLLMNPTLDRSAIDLAYRNDPKAAQAEWGAQFREDLEQFVTHEAVDACLDFGVHERGRMPGARFQAFCDPAGGSGQESMTVAIAHREDEQAIVDAIRERRPPFSPEDVVAEFAKLLRVYGCSTVVGDRYAGQWPTEAFARHGIRYKPAELTKSGCSVEFLPILNARRVRLLEDERLVQQLIGLERRTVRGGRESIDHPRGGHDDVANVVAGCVVQVLRREKVSEISLNGFQGPFLNSHGELTNSRGSVVAEFDVSTEEGVQMARNWAEVWSGRVR